MKSLFKPSIHGFGLLYLLVNMTSAFNTSSSTDDDIKGAKGDIPNNSKGGDGLDGRLADDRLKDNNHANIQPNDTGSSSSGTTYYYNNNEKYTNKPMFNANNYDDEQTYLDLFGERAKELLTQHIIPSTDAECKWDWRMGRCEPYCICGFNFLWGDYHLGRSCRYRTFFPQDDEVINDVSNDKAWQQVWETKQMPEDESVDATSSTSTCTLPPESRYTQIIKQLNKGFTHSTVVIDQFQKVKTNVVDASVISGKHHWKNMRQKACETVKTKVEERAHIRDQPVVLTKQGATWIRRVCGTEGNPVVREDDDVIADEGIISDPAKADENDNAAGEEESWQ